MKENILLFGGNSFLAKAFNKRYGDAYFIENVYRNHPEQKLNFDFERDDIQSITDKLNGPYKAVLFFQGLNPSVGAREMSEQHFNSMLKVSIIMPALLIKSLEDKLSEGALVLFVSSVAKKKGSYDPAYASTKAGLIGLMHSLASTFQQIRFNVISPGLIKNSPVFNHMTEDFKQKHAASMFGHEFIKADDVINIIAELINNKSINRTDIEIDGGYS